MARRSRGLSLPVAPRAWRAPIPSPGVLVCGTQWYSFVLVGSFVLTSAQTPPSCLRPVVPSTSPEVTSALRWGTPRALLRPA